MAKEAFNIKFITIDKKAKHLIQEEIDQVLYLEH